MERNTIEYSVNVFCTKIRQPKTVFFLSSIPPVYLQQPSYERYIERKMLLSLQQTEDLDGKTCSCYSPETNVNCNKLLAANIPATPRPAAAPKENVDILKDGSDKTPTWIIVMAIAMFALTFFMAYGAVVWRRGRERRGVNQGVDDFV